MLDLLGPQFEVNELDLPRCFEQLEAGDGGGKGEAAGAGAARIYIKHAIAQVRVGFVGVARDDNVEARGFGVEVEILEPVQHVDGSVGEFDDLGQRERACPGFRVHVAAYSMDRGDGLKLFEDGEIADIAGVEDGAGPFESREGFRAKEAVRV